MNKTIPEIDEKRNDYRLRKRLYTVKEAGEYLGLSVWSIRERIYSGQIAHVSIGRRVMVDIEDMDELIQANKERVKE